MAVQQAAAYWDARLRNPNCRDEERAAFRRWIAEDPLHAEVYEQLQRSVSALRSAAHRPEIRALRDSALARRHDVTLRTAALAAVLLLAAVTLPVGLGLLGGSPGAREPAAADQLFAEDYSTAIGQRSGITLEDGSVVTLNTDSRIQVSYSDDERLIKLLRGQALFEVAHDADRPFAVLAGDQRVVALGTTFDVRLNDRDVEVVLVEGKVEIVDVQGTRQASAKLVQLESGERLVARAAAPPVITRIDTGKATSWREGHVSFEDAPLIQAIAEMNRYSKIQIQANDPELAEYRVNGVFRSGQQARFVEALEAYFPVVAERDGDAIVLKMSHPS